MPARYTPVSFAAHMCLPYRVMVGKLWSLKFRRASTLPRYTLRKGKCIILSGKGSIGRWKQLPQLRILCKSDDDLDSDGGDDLLGGVDEAVLAFCRRTCLCSGDIELSVVTAVVAMCCPFKSMPFNDGLWLLVPAVDTSLMDVTEVRLPCCILAWCSSSFAAI